MPKSRYVALALSFGVFAGIVAVVVQIGALATMGTAVTGGALIAAAIGGAGVFVVSFLTALFVWPRIGFDPFGTDRRQRT